MRETNKKLLAAVLQISWVVGAFAKGSGGFAGGGSGNSQGSTGWGAVSGYRYTTGSTPRVARSSGTGSPTCADSSGTCEDGSVCSPTTFACVGTFYCSNGKVIRGDRVCDAFNDCGDNSDERSPTPCQGPLTGAEFGAYCGFAIVLLAAIWITWHEVCGSHANQVYDIDCQAWADYGVHNGSLLYNIGSLMSACLLLLATAVIAITAKAQNLTQEINFNICSLVFCSPIAVWTVSLWREKRKSQPVLQAPTPIVESLVESETSRVQLVDLKGRIPITVPTGATAGCVLQVRTPDGQLIQAKVPARLGPGQLFIARYPLIRPLESGSLGSRQALSKAQPWTAIFQRQNVILPDIDVDGDGEASGESSSRSSEDMSSYSSGSDSSGSSGSDSSSSCDSGSDSDSADGAAGEAASKNTGIAGVIEGVRARVAAYYQRRDRRGSFQEYRHCRCARLFCLGGTGVLAQPRPEGRRALRKRVTYGRPCVFWLLMVIALIFQAARPSPFETYPSFNECNPLNECNVCAACCLPQARVSMDWHANSCDSCVASSCNANAVPTPPTTSYPTPYPTPPTPYPTPARPTPYPTPARPTPYPTSAWLDQWCFVNPTSAWCSE
jgi:hypothetical protein